MTIRYDKKGKYFTDVVSKEPCQAIIQTCRGQIHGTIHLGRDNRLIDELHQASPFLAVTGVRFLETDSSIETEFMAINKNQVIWIIPVEEDAHSRGQDGKD